MQVNKVDNNVSFGIKIPNRKAWDKNVLKAFVEQAQNWEWTEHNLHEKLDGFRAEFKEKGIKPRLAVVMVGDNKASQVYVKNKRH